MNHYDVIESGKVRINAASYPQKPSGKVREGKKIAAREGGGKGQSGLILREKEYHGWYNSVNKHLSEDVQKFVADLRSTREPTIRG